MISIIIPCYNEQKYISLCLDSLISSDMDRSYEVLVVDGGSEDKTRDIVKEYTQEYGFIHLLDNPHRYAPHGMNIGIAAAQGEYLFIISAHAHYAQGYFKDLVHYSQELNAECVGPLLRTDVKEKTDTSLAIKNVMSDRFGVGSSFRTNAHEIKEVDTVAFGCYTKACFEHFGVFNEKLIRNQDIELNKRIRHLGGKIYLIPQVQATYYARENFKALAKNAYENGKWNVLTALYTGTLRSLSIRHFIPMLFVLTLVSLSVMLPYCSLALYVLVSIMSVYGLLVVFRSLRISPIHNFFRQVYAFVVLHFSYGFGSLMGIIRAFRLLIKGNF